MANYIGKTAVVKKSYAWIDITSVTMADGSPHDLETNQDIYLHAEDCDFSLQPNMEIEFSAHPDKKRGEGAFRAFGAHESTRARLERLTMGGVELHVQNLDKSQLLEQSSVFASWCLSADVVAKIKEHRLNGEAVKLLIVHWPIDRRTERTEQRQLVDITDPMCAIGFNSGGVNRIVALVVVGPRLGDRFLSLSGGCYAGTVIAHDDCGTVLEKDEKYLASGVIEVEVPEGLFAKRPLDWAWVNKFFETDPRDQCALRRRRIFAYTLQPIVVLLMGVWGGLKWLASFICILGMLSVGTRGINYAPLRHPLDHAPGDTWWNTEGSVFTPEIKGRRIPLLLAFSPLVLLVATTITCLIEGIHLGTLEWWITFGKVMLTPVVIFGLVTILAFWLGNVDWEKGAEKRRQEERRRFEAEIDELLCNPTSARTPDAWRLPFGPKTVRFYALALKQKVCKGFSAA